MLIDIRTDYNLLDSLIKTEDLAKFAKESGWKYVGIADLEAGGLLDFYLQCKANDIKPIIGLRFYVTNSLEEFSDSQIMLYAQNLEGYHNLLRLSTKASLGGSDNGGATLLVDWLEGTLGTNLVCLLPIGESPKEAKTIGGDNVIKRLKQIYKNKLFWGLYDRDTGGDDIWLKIAKDNKIPYIFLSGAKYFKSEDFRAYKVLRAINEGKTVDRIFEVVYLDESIEVATKKMYHYQHYEYMVKFLSLIDIEIPTPGLKVPKFPIPDGFKDSFEYLADLCRDGYKKKILEFDTPEKVKACKERVAIEFDVIKRCDLADYFLLVYDICQFCYDKKIPQGWSRGSVGGCLVAFLMDISRTNPLEYGLLFERFLNEDRTKPVEFNGEKYLTDAPDIDLDVGQIQRQEVIEFLRQKYGNVAKISTYSTLSSKNCIKDVMKTFGKFENEAAYVAKFVEVRFGKSDSLEETYSKSSGFKAWADKNKEIYETALKIEDIRKNCSTHAAGCVVSDQPIENFAPLRLANATKDGDYKQDICIAYSLDYAAKAGLLKVDILGIRGLNVLSDCMELVNHE